MQAQPYLNPHPQFPIQELEQIEAALQASQQWVTTLQGRRDKLTAELEKITRPQVAPSKLAMKSIGPGLDYLGRITHHWNYIDIYIDLLHRLWTEYPEHREAMARAMRSCGNTRVYVSRTRESLFPGHQLPWARRHSRQLVDGWYIDTNLNRERMRRIMPAAVHAAGLTWGQDVRAYWRATQLAL
jgi:hypothetical protein